MTAAPSTSRRTLYILIALFFLPLVAAFVLYYGGVWRPQDSTEHGDLIHPARPLPEVALIDMQGQPASKLLHERWSLVYIGSGDCDERCRAALADMQRARQLLGKDLPRVQAVFMVSGACCNKALLESMFADTRVVRVDEPSATGLLAMFPTYGGTPVTSAGRIYIVDPLGNLMMSYAPDASSIGLYEDLKKLLKLSHIG